MSVSGIEALGFTPAVIPTVSTDRTASAAPATATQGPTGPGFAKLLADGVDGLEALQDKRDGLALQAATGDLGALHDYTIAATETSVATQLTVAVRNKAIEAFNEIMRMQV